MCIAFWLLDSLPEFTLLLAFNRDELLDRETVKAHVWQDQANHNHVLGGRDVAGGGTWLAVSKNGRLAFLTNYREDPVLARSISLKGGVPSRGVLPVDFVTSNTAPAAFLEGLQFQEFAGYNLLVADLGSTQSHEMWHYSNRGAQEPRRIPPGLHGVSNTAWDTEWEKVIAGKAAWQQLADGGKLDSDQVPWDDIWGIMSDAQILQSDAASLPRTGYGADFERHASAIFIPPFSSRWGHFGTRSQMVLAVRRDGSAELRERYLENDTWREEGHVFTMDIT
jgi:uncharacterized protein with NRDE domain